VTSAKGAGSRFRILFPPARDRAPAAAPRDTRPVVQWRGEGTVLLVDDEDMVRSVARLMLQRLGFQVILASDGREAVEAFRARKDEIAAVVLDMTMPNMDGNEALVELRRIRPAVRVLLTSGFTAEDVASDVGRNGSTGFLQKPFNSAMLAEKLKALFAAVRAGTAEENGKRGGQST